MRNLHGSVCPMNRNATPRFGSLGVRTATVDHGSPNHRISCGKQTAVVRDIILNRFSEMDASCAALTSHINPPSSSSSYAVMFSQGFHAPRVQTRRCPIHSWHSHSFLTPFAFTHATVLASDRIFTAFSPLSHSCALLVSHKDPFSTTFLSIWIRTPLSWHPMAFSRLLTSLEFWRAILLYGCIFSDFAFSQHSHAPMFSYPIAF